MFRNPCHRLKMKSEWGSRRNLRCWPEIVPRLCVARAKERQVTRVLKCSCRLFSIINSKSDPRFRPLFYFRGNCCYALNSNPSRCPYHGGTSTTMATNRRCTCHQTHNAKWQKGEGPKIQHKKKCWWRSSAYLSLVFVFFRLACFFNPSESDTHTTLRWLWDQDSLRLSRRRPKEQMRFWVHPPTVVGYPICAHSRRVPSTLEETPMTNRQRKPLIAF